MLRRTVPWAAHGRQLREGLGPVRGRALAGSGGIARDWSRVSSDAHLGAYGQREADACFSYVGAATGQRSDGEGSGACKQTHDRSRCNRRALRNDGWPAGPSGLPDLSMTESHRRVSGA